MADSYPRFSRSYEQHDPSRREYRSGYEPSAPPYYHEEEEEQLDRLHHNHPPSAPPPPSSHNEFDEFPHPSRHGEDFPREHREQREPTLGQPEHGETLGGYMFTRMIRPLWRGSHTVLRVDLRRSLAYDGPVLNNGRRHRSAPSGAVASSGGRDYFDGEHWFFFSGTAVLAF